MLTLNQHELHSLERLTLKWAGAIDPEDPRFKSCRTIATIIVAVRNTGVRPIGEPLSSTITYFENCHHTPELAEIDMLWVILICSYDVTIPPTSFDILPPKVGLLEDDLFKNNNEAFGKFFPYFFPLKVALDRLRKSYPAHSMFHLTKCFLNNFHCLPLENIWLSMAVCNALRIRITQILPESPFQSVANYIRSRLSD